MENMTVYLVFKSFRMIIVFIIISRLIVLNCEKSERNCCLIVLFLIFLGCHIWKIIWLAKRKKSTKKSYYIDDFGCNQKILDVFSSILCRSLFLEAF